jgi:flavin-dependent dehydrogenase
MALPDICVVGAGPAGLACAIAAAQRGMRVHVLDAAREGPIDKACGEGLLPDALACLDRMGICSLQGHPIAGIRFLADGRVAEARFRGCTGMGVRRTELHRAMLERAAELGVTIEWAAPLHALNGIEARFIAGADGSQSRVRFLASLDGRVTTQRIGLRQHFAVSPWSECVEVSWAAGAQAYVTPVDEQQVGVAFLSRQKFGSIAEALKLFPDLQQRLAGAQTMSTARGAATVTRRLPHVTRGNIALVGDASGSVDAITGEGMNLCFQQAERLAEAMAQDNLAFYESAHPKTMRMARTMSAALLLMGQSPLIRQGAMRLLAAAPTIFEALLGMHVTGLLLGRDKPKTRNNYNRQQASMNARGGG